MSINSPFRTLITDNIEGIVSNKNYVKNSFEDPVVIGWRSFSVDVPVNLPVGFTSPTTITSGITVSTANPLYGKGSLIAQTGPFENWLKGEGFFSDEFTIEPSDYNQPFEAYFDYQILSGTGINFSGILGSQTFGVFLYSPSTGTWLQPTNYLGFNNNSTVNRMKVQFTALPDVYQLAFVALTADAIEPLIKFDNFNVYRQNQVTNAVSPSSFFTGINNNQTTPLNTGLNVDLDSDGFAIDYASIRAFKQLSPLLNQSFMDNIGKTNIGKITSPVKRIIQQPDGKILVAGQFFNYGAVNNRNNLIRFNANGTVDTSFCANAVDGGKFNNSVLALALQPDGKILVGGGFVSYGGTTNRNRLVRLNSDGTVDEGFCIAAVDGTKFNNGQVNTITVQSDGKILVGGTFQNYAGTSGRNRLIRLNSGGTVDDDFCVSRSDGNKFNFDVFNTAQQPDDKILIVGWFDNYETPGRNGLLRINTDNTLDTDFCIAAVDGKFGTSQVLTVAVQSDGRILVGGGFTNYGGGGIGRSFLIRLNDNGTVDEGFCIAAVDGTKFSAQVNSVFVLPNQNIVVGGSFSNYAGTSGRNRLILLDNNGIVNGTFCTNASDGSKITALVEFVYGSSTNEVLVGGQFTSYAGVINRFIYLNSDGTVNTLTDSIAGFQVNISGNVNSVAIQPNGQILIGGDFINYKGVSGRNRLVRLNSDGTVDEGFCFAAVDGNKFNASVRSIVIQPNNQILVGGDYTNYGGTSGRNRLIRLNSGGTVDEGFCIAAVDGNKFNGQVYVIEQQSDGKILVGGFFANYGATSGRSNLIRLNDNGSVDGPFCTVAADGTKFNNAIFSVIVQSDGKILVGGTFQNYAGTSGRNRLIRLNSGGTVDDDFCIAVVDGNKFNGTVFAIAQQTDGKILVGGSFTNYGGTTNRNRLIRINTNNTVDADFCIAAVDGNNRFINTVNAILQQPDGKILVGGVFTNYKGIVNRNNLIRLNSDGNLDTTFCIYAVDGSKLNTTPLVIRVDSSFNLYIGGQFTMYNSQYGYFFSLSPQHTGFYEGLSGVGRIQGTINNLTGSIPTSSAYAELGTSGVTLQVDNAGNVQYTSNNQYAYPDYEPEFGYMSLFLDNL